MAGVLGLGERGEDIDHVVAVHRHHVEAKGVEFGVDRFGRQNFGKGAVELEVVDVDDDDEVVELILGRCQRAFPDNAFVDLAIAEDGVDLVILFLEQLAFHGDADGLGVAEAEGAGGGVDPGQVGGDRVPLQAAVVLAQGLEFFNGHVAAHGERRVPDRAGVALGENKAVTVLPLGVGRIEVHQIEVECGDEVGRRQRSSDVPGLGGVDHVNDIDAHGVG